jgi:hypothetical protein
VLLRVGIVNRPPEPLLASPAWRRKVEVGICGAGGRVWGIGGRASSPAGRGRRPAGRRGRSAAARLRDERVSHRHCRRFRGSDPAASRRTSEWPRVKARPLGGAQDLSLQIPLKVDFHLHRA